MSLALSQDVILFSSPPSLSHSIFWPQWWAVALVFAVIHRHAYGDLSLGALKRTKVNDKLSFCLSFPLSVSLSSPPQSEVFNLPCSPGQGFGICQSPQACLGPQSSEWIPERWKRVEKWDIAQRKQGQKSTGICIGLRFLILFSSFFSTFLLQYYYAEMKRQFWSRTNFFLSHSLPPFTILLSVGCHGLSRLRRLRVWSHMLHFHLSTMSATHWATITMLWHSQTIIFPISLSIFHQIDKLKKYWHFYGSTNIRLRWQHWW